MSDEPSSGVVLARDRASGLPLRYTGGTFWLEPEGRITADQVRERDLHAQLVWTDEAVHEWFRANFAADAVGRPDAAGAVAPITAQVAQVAAKKPDTVGQIAGFAGIALGLGALVMPYFAAVFLVPLAFGCGIIAFVRGRRLLGSAAVVMAAVGLIGVLAVSQQISDRLAPFTGGSTSSSGGSQTVTLAEYNDLQTGISYEAATLKIGASGTEISRSDIGGYSTVMYSWTNSDGSNMNAMFQNGELVNKAQFGLH